MLTLTQQPELKQRNEWLEAASAQHDKRLAQRIEEQHTKKERELLGELAYVKRQLEALQRKLFGQSHGELISAAQLQLALSELDREEAEPEEAAKEVIAYTRRRSSPEEAQARLPANMETITEEIIPAQVYCPCTRRPGSHPSDDHSLESMRRNPGRAHNLRSGLAALVQSGVTRRLGLRRQCARNG